MQKNDIMEFFQKIDSHLSSFYTNRSQNKKFNLRVFGKSALMLAGLSDSVGTNDIDILKVEGQSDSAPEIIESLEKEFGRNRVKVHGYCSELGPKHI